ncbi:hypothetical protein B0T16DRAFT_400011 [Cercophora newfieldiana]|uniref:Uncharacterized protein n=1 Tax=Cercophora newfieldiana TaxID=92897 RepID=A0AA39YSP3_9PEZI|nr:hypothetical protein B0T16DRAFT_400011 [Cercophora newfieldiana]
MFTGIWDYTVGYEQEVYLDGCLERYHGSKERSIIACLLWLRLYCYYYPHLAHSRQEDLFTFRLWVVTLLFSLLTNRGWLQGVRLGLSADYKVSFLLFTVLACVIPDENTYVVLVKKYTALVLFLFLW